MLLDFAEEHIQRQQQAPPKLIMKYNLLPLISRTLGLHIKCNTVIKI
jgi:hypothetical protein